MSIYYKRNPHFHYARATRSLSECDLCGKLRIKGNHDKCSKARQLAAANKGTE